MSILKPQPRTIEKAQHPTIEFGFGGMLPLPTEVPGTLTFTLTALPAAIGLAIMRPATGGRAQGYRYRVRRRNAADTAWESVQPWVDLGTRRSATITQYSVMQAIEVGRQYQVKVIAYNVVGDGTESAYMDVVPLTNVPAVPTFALEAHDGSIRLTINKVADPLGGEAFYEWDGDARNAADTDWSSLQGTFIRAGDASGLSRIVRETDTQIVIDIINQINDRAIRIRVRSGNADIKSDWSAYMEATPMAGVMPAMRPGIPTFTLSLDPSAFGDILINISPTGSEPVTHWITRDRVKGATDWNTVVETADVSEFTFTATAGQTIEVQIAARNSAGDSDFAAIQEIRIIDVPNMPTLALTAVPAGFNVQITDAVAGDPADNAFFRYREGISGDWIEGTVLQVRSLKENTLYQVQAWTTNDAGRSTAAVATVTTLMIPLVLPLVPTFTVSVVSQFNPFDYSVDPRQNAAEPTTITHWNIRYREQGTTDWTNERVTNASGATYGNTLDRLTVRGKTYEFQVAAENSDGVGPYAASQTITFIDVPTRPDLFLTAQPAGFDVRIAFPPSGSRADSGHFRYREQGTTDWTDGNPLNTEVRGLDGLTTYEVQAWTSNRAGESLRASRTVTTLAAPMPRAGRAFMFGGDTVVTPAMPTGAFERVGAGTLTPEFTGLGLGSVGNVLYLVGRATAVLYTVNLTTGVVTRVGSSTAFGVGETNPRGLAGIGTTLYMAGSDTDALYIVDTTTGVATRVGSATNFGVNENLPAELASIGTTLYMIGQRNNALYIVNTTTGVATRVGRATNWGVGLTQVQGLAAIGSTLYMSARMVSGSIAPALYIVDTTTGVATRVGSATNWGVPGIDLVGIAPIGNRLYANDVNNAHLYRSLLGDPATVQKPPQHFIVGGKSFSIGV